MKSIKLKTVLAVCCLLSTAISCGCAVTFSVDTDDKPQNAPDKVQSESGTNGSKQTLKEKALFAYREILKAAPAIEGEYPELADASFGYEQNLKLFGNHFELFALHDINRDDIPELIALSTVNFRWAPISVYTYSDGKATLLKADSDMSAHGTFEQRSTANGAYSTYICKQNHIHSVWRGNDAAGNALEENRAYILEKAALTAAECTAGEDENTVYFHDIARANTAENADAVIQ